MTQHFDRSFHSCRDSCPFANHASLRVGVDLETTLKILATLGPCQLLIKGNGLTSLTLIDLGDLRQGERFPTDGHRHLFVPEQIRPLLFRCPFTSALRVVLAPPNRAGQVSLTFPKTPWDSLQTQEISARLACRDPRPAGACLKHCQQWLDDWAPVLHRKVRDHLSHDLQLIRTSKQIDVLQSQDGIGFQTSFSPRFIDLDDTTIRISARQQKHIALAELNQIKVTPRRSGRVSLSLREGPGEGE